MRYIYIYTPIFVRFVQFAMLEGHNRSPTLALSFFLHSGQTLREAGRGHGTMAG